MSDFQRPILDVFLKVPSDNRSDLRRCLVVELNLYAIVSIHVVDTLEQPFLCDIKRYFLKLAQNFISFLLYTYEVNGRFIIFDARNN